MPWTPTDYPSAMRNLPSVQRRHAIEIANAILADGGEEGTAISTGIARAKDHFEKKGTASNLNRLAADELAPKEETQQTVSAPTGGPHAFAATAAEETSDPASVDPEDPTIHIVGYGVMRRSQIEQGVIQRLEDIVTRAKNGDWRNAIYLFKNGVPGAMMEALDHHQKTGIWYDPDSSSYKKLTQPREL